MKRNHLKTKLAMTAIGALIALPSFADSTTTSEHHLLPAWMTSWTHKLAQPFESRTTNIDRVNGNDFRDNRDSTIMRNDVPLDQTTLSRGSYTSHSSAASTYQSEPSYRTNERTSMSNDQALPPTAVREDDRNAVAMQSGPAVQEPQNVEQAAQLHEPIVAQPDNGQATADETVVQGAPEASTAQSSDQGLADMTTPAPSQSSSADMSADTNSTNVTARNMSGTQPVTSTAGTVGDGNSIGRESVTAGTGESQMGQ